MTNADQVFEMFAAANPVPDEEHLRSEAPPPVRDATTPLASLAPVRTIEPGRPRWHLVAAAMLIVIGTGGAWAWITRTSDPQPARPPDTATTIETRALRAVEVWLSSIESGNVDAVMELSGLATRDREDRRVHEWAAGFAAAGVPTVVTDCRVITSTVSSAAVECRATVMHPVAAELGLPELVAPFSYADGLVDWQPYRGGDLGAINAAFAAYASAYEPEQFELSCRPAAYEPGTFIQNGGVALTGECAALLAPLAEDVAQWLREGRPAP